ncbi:MRC1-like domain-containing protein [Annulohypoxylon truncatum]|uniref:MRC1-like domain-containing protein n=1 Tax=Annulohypoxylon truncatum TaxID=327061 RepID=UPI002008455C|nr:MRC1-like domain-containing protein [Annulohypoxylon truncatum]KAI1211652.1 MRC1-like domain-containing protein [Annulohypoxylon truncatum]
MRADDTNKSAKTQNNNEDNNESTNADNDEEDISALPRRRLARPNRQATPEVTADSETPPSPGLFVTPAPETPVALRQSVAEPDTDDELPQIAGKSERFMALVAKKREERLAKEAEKKRKDEERAKRMAEQMPAESEVDDDVSDITDDDGGRQLTQIVSRPAARKASKKALEEMNRETQRISRSLQLAHEAKTKKKITKDSLFERFNFRKETAPSDNKPTSSSRPTTPGSQHTDADMVDAGTPPSSPPLAPKSVQDNDATPTVQTTSVQINNVLGEDDDELPSLEDALAQSKKEDKGKGKAVESIAVPSETKTAAAKPRRQVRVKMPPIQANLVAIDSDDELEITNSKKGRMDSIFNKLPEKKAQESNSMNILRRLAHLSSPPREPTRGRKAKPSMTPAELQMSLQQRARAQAKLERDRRLELLRSKGINVLTEEERQRERDQVEDIVARARQEVEEIMQREREDAKKTRKERKEEGENDPLAWDDSDDDSYEESEKEKPAEVELSGSEEEGDEDDEMDDAEDEDEDESTANPMFENEAEEGGESEEQQTPKAKTQAIASDDEADDELPAIKSRRSKKHVQIVSDDEDEVEATPKPKVSHWKSPSATHSSSPKVPTSVLRSATKTFIPGLPVPVAAPAGLGLTQIFAGTMDDSQGGPINGSPMQFTASIDNFPDSQFSATAGQSQNDMVLDSQKEQNLETQARETQTQGVQLHFSQSQAHGFDTLIQMDATQMTDFIEPTQDGGFQDFSPLKQRFVDAPQSTVDTVLPSEIPDYETIEDSPLVKRGGRLIRRRPSTLASSTLAYPEVPGSPSPASRDPEAGANAAASAFKVMEKAAKRKKRMQEKFDKKKSKANEMVEEQAEESEDEYAGLGGVDGEDSSDEDEELVKEMIDDAVGNNVDDAKLAGFYADRERAADAAQVDKLFHDITTGMLRKRRRGGGNHDYDLSDSDDEGEARRRMKQRQFAKMRKALYADERISKIAENSRNAAFLKSIEDLGSDEEWDFGENVPDSAHESTGEESQSQEQRKDTPAAEQSIPDSQPTDGRKRAHEGDHAPRPPPNARRTKAGTRPTSITDVRRELSDLLDEPNGSAASIIPATELGSDEEDEERPKTASSNKENRTPDVAVVDRIKMKRDSSSLSAAGSSRLAFAAPSASGSGGFKVPALLRRATTNSLISSSSTSSSGGNVATGNAGGPGLGLSKAGEDGKLLKKTAGKRSGINYFARENERRAAVADAEKRREAKKWKGAEGRGKVVGGLFGGGKFE